MKNIVIELWGSSIMEGVLGVENPADRWFALLRSELEAMFPDTAFSVINGAVGGESSREIMARFNRDFLPYNPDYALVMFGFNNDDFMRPERVLKPGEFERLMENFSMRLPLKTKPVGIVGGPIIDKYHFWTTHPAFREYLSQFGGSLDRAEEPEREKFRAFLRKRQWPVLDLYDLLKSDPEKYIRHCDGVHLSPEGHRCFAHAVALLLKTLIEENNHG